LDKLTVNMVNCYGIKSLAQEFSFSLSRANIIYAPNGIMKTSLSNTFKQIANGNEPEEKLYGRQPEYTITIDETDIKAEEILVIEPFNPSFDAVNLSTLLVNPEKKAQYDSLYKSIFDAKKSLIIELNKLSKISKNEIEKTLCDDSRCSDIFEAVRWLQSSQLGQSSYKDIQYKQMFDPKVIDLLSDTNIAENIVEYIERYNALIESSSLFKTGVFNISKAMSVSSSLKKDNFFEAEHKIILNGREGIISTHDDLNVIFEEEKAELLSDNRLQQINSKLMAGAASVKMFQNILEKNPEIAVELSDIPEFKKIMWSTYYSEKKEQFDSLLALFDTNKAELASIENEAKLEETLWYQAVEVFKDRFHVPFTLNVENHANAILGTVAPNIVFSFTNESNESVTFDRGQLTSLDVLSVGERRAMYLLYVIFEIKSRQASGKRTIIVVDDIADSFDYKNKYAIIEYLKEIIEEDLFRMLVLTHNFDFYRTFQSRVLTGRSKRGASYIAQKSENQSIVLLSGGDNYVSNPFDVWRRDISNNPAIIVSMIPFVRNLIEYKDGNSAEDYRTLTSLLHIKENTSDIRLSNLESIISSTINNATFNEGIDRNKSVIEFIYETADALCIDPVLDEIRLENKVTLSIAIRLKSEAYMWSKVTDTSVINGNQTGKLYDRYICGADLSSEAVKTAKRALSQVMLMTPENIHINSFMYEPLMDLSVHHLVGLYETISDMAA
jgi:hypothetical protein